jgi:hypothetical protein
MRDEGEAKEDFVHGVFLWKCLGLSVGVLAKNQLQVCALVSSLLSVTVSRGLIKIMEAVSAIEFRGVFLVVSTPPPPIFSERTESHLRVGYS